MRVTANNQSLILAGESPSPAAGSPAAGSPAAESRALLTQASQMIAGGPLKRMTILAARPDTTVVVQADYYSPNETAPTGSPLPALAHGEYAALDGADNATAGVSAAGDPIVVQANSATLSRPRPLSSYLNPIEYYARAQRAFENPARVALLNVLA